MLRRFDPAAVDAAAADDDDDDVDDNDNDDDNDYYNAKTVRGCNFFALVTIISS